MRANSKNRCIQIWFLVENPPRAGRFEYTLKHSNSQNSGWIVLLLLDLFYICLIWIHRLLSTMAVNTRHIHAGEYPYACLRVLSLISLLAPPNKQRSSLLLAKTKMCSSIFSLSLFQWFYFQQELGTLPCDFKTTCFVPYGSVRTQTSYPGGTGGYVAMTVSKMNRTPSAFHIRIYNARQSFQSPDCRVTVSIR